MSSQSAQSERFPVGTFTHTDVITESQRRLWIEELRQLPTLLRSAIANLDAGQLDTPYRDGGWTVRQVVHHLPDSHINSYVRFRLALTEDQPTIRPYQEDRWAELTDARTGPVAPSLQILEGLHSRWTSLLASLHDEHFARAFVHPELGNVRLDWALGLYAWHSRHHVAHIARLRDRMGW